MRWVKSHTSYVTTSRVAPLGNLGKSKIPLDTAEQRRLKRENGMVTAAAVPRRRAAVFTGE